MPGAAAALARLEALSASEGRAYERLAWLTDRIGARLAGSPQAAMAERWAAGVLRADGHEAVRLEPVTVPVWVRGYEHAEIVAPARQPLAVLALGGSIGTPPGGLEAEVVEVDSFAALEALGEGARDRIVLYNRDMGRGMEEGYGRVVALRSRGAAEAAKRGARGMLLRSLGTAAFRLPHTGAMNYEADVPRIPAAAIAEEDADLLHRLLAAGGPVRVRLVLGCEPRPDGQGANVVGDLRGRELPREIVLIGAHLDSWDVGTGAIDDGAGVAIVIEALRLLRRAGLVPRRTVRAVLFANEENGLAGGRAYATDHAAELDAHVVAIESDSGGAAPMGWGVTAGEGGVEQLQGMATLLSGLGAGSVTAGGGGADISRLKPAGVPQIGMRQDTTNYFDFHHTHADTLDKVRPDELQRNALALAAIAWMLAEAAEPLPRLPAGGGDPP